MYPHKYLIETSRAVAVSVGAACFWVRISIERSQCGRDEMETAVPGSEAEEYVRGRGPFLAFLSEWYGSLRAARLPEVIEEAGGPGNVVIVCADVTNCFTRYGPLYSPRVATIVPPIVDLLKLAYSLGIRDFVLPEDNHPIDSPEFEAWGPHCAAGTKEAETVADIKDLPFSDLFLVFPKQNLNPGIDTAFPGWLEEHPNMRRFIVVGDCTDLCIYQTVTFLRLRANQFKLEYDVIVPANCVNTFDIPVETARANNMLPYDADLIHPLFLYHMVLNGIRVVRELVP